MLPAFPSLNIGTPVQRGDVVVYPIYVAQLSLFDKLAPEQSWSVATSAERKRSSPVITNERPQVPGPDEPRQYSSSVLPATGSRGRFA